MDRDPDTRSYLNYPLLSSETPSQPASPAGSESRAAAATWGWNGNGRSQGVPVPPGGSGGYLAPSESPTGYSVHNDVAQPPAAEPGVIRRAQSSRRLQGKQGNVVRETRARCASTSYNNLVRLGAKFEDQGLTLSRFLLPI